MVKFSTAGVLRSITALFSIVALHGCVNNGVSSVPSSAGYVSEIERELIPRDAALAFVRQHFEIQDGHAILLSLFKRSGSGAEATQSRWFAITNCVVVYGWLGEVVNIYKKGGIDNLDARGGVWQTMSHHPSMFEPNVHETTRIMFGYDVPGRVPMMAAATPKEVANINSRLAAALVVLGAHPAPGGTYDLNQYIMGLK